VERNVVFIALFAALIAALGYIPLINLPNGVPITAQSLGVMLCGTVLGSRRGALAALLFLMLVLIGLPLLSGGRGGIGLLASGSGGFLIGWPVGAFVTGLIVEHWKRIPLVPCATIASIVGGIVVIYLFGLAGLVVNAKMSVAAAAATMLAYVPGDIIKAVVAGLITGALYRARPASVLARA